MSCVFCEIVSGELPSHQVLADDEAVAFLDQRPLFKGHVLVVPRRHVVTLTDLPVADVEPLFRRVRHIAGAMAGALGAAGSFVAMNNVVSQSVPHLHVHVVPRNPKDGLRGFFWPRTKYEDNAEMAAVASTIRRWLDENPEPDRDGKNEAATSDGGGSP